MHADRSFNVSLSTYLISQHFLVIEVFLVKFSVYHKLHILFLAVVIFHKSNHEKRGSYAMALARGRVIPKISSISQPTSFIHTIFDKNKIVTKHQTRVLSVQRNFFTM